MALPLLLAGIGAATGAAGLVGSLLSKPKSVSVPDIAGELAKINALYEQAKQAALADVNYQAGQDRGTLAANLATRGLRTSPVSQNAFGRFQENVGRQRANVVGGLAGQQAATQSSLLQSLLGANLGAQQYNAEAQAGYRRDLFGGLGSIGTSLLMAGLSARAPAPSTASLSPAAQYTGGQSAAGGFGFGGGYSRVNPYLALLRGA